MKKLKTMVSFAAVSAVMVFSLAGPAFALSGADQCYLVVTHVSTTLNVMHDVSDKRESVFKDAATRANKQIESAKVAGFDPNQLQADYNMLNSDIEQFHADRQTLETALTDVQTASQGDCSSSSTQLAGALKIARAQLVLVRNDDVKARVDIRQKIIPDVRAYATWLRGKANPGAPTN